MNDIENNDGIDGSCDDNGNGDTVTVKLPNISVSLVHPKCGEDALKMKFGHSLWLLNQAVKTGEINLSIHRNLVCSLLHQTLHSILDNHRCVMTIIFKESTNIIEREI